MKLIVQVHRENGLAFQQDELADVGGDVLDAADLAAESAALGITQAQLIRRMFRIWRFVRAVMDRVPSGVATVEKTPAEMAAEREARRLRKLELAALRAG